MSSAKQNQSIAKLIVGAMSIDGSLDKSEREKIAITLEKIGMAELIADVGAAIENDCGTFNMFEECNKLRESLGSEAKELSPMIFRIIVDAVASDRFISAREAAYLSSLSKRLELTIDDAKTIMTQVMALRRGRLEVAASGVDELLNPQLKELLSFKGSEDLVGEASEDSIETLLHDTTEALAEGERVCVNELERSLTILGLKTTATLEDAEQVWKETIDNLNLPKMADLGETFVSAAINRITRINKAYKTILHFHEKTPRGGRHKKAA